MLEISKLKLKLAESEILKGIDFTLGEKNLVTILGPNGSGKSTLIKTICGINKNYSGSIVLNQKELKDYSHKELARLISYVPQFLEIHARYTVWDFMEMSLFSHMNGFRGLNTIEKDRANEILNRFSLSHLKHRLMNSLSGGERQKVFIASSIFQGPSLLLLDEPTSYLDPKHQDEVNEIIFSLSNEMAVILVSHDINSSIINSSRVIGLKEGEVFFDGSPKEVLHKSELGKLFDKEFDLMTHPKKDIEFIVPKVFK
jgi:iron complex transport system ATP-binding protein